MTHIDMVGVEMSEIGKMVRIERIMDRDSRNLVVIPMDHGISIGPTKGLLKMTDTINRIAEGGANAVLLLSLIHI
mgnify:CR=1 FL=1